MSIKRFVLTAMVGVFTLVAAPMNTDKMDGLSIIKDIDGLEAKNLYRYTLAELLKAADTNYALQAKALNSLQAKKGLFASKLAFLPSFNIGYNFQNNNVGDTTNSLNYNIQAADARFTWNLFNGFATLNLIAQKNASYFASMADEEYTRQNIHLQIIQQYYGYFDNASKLISLQKKLAQIKSDLERVEKLYNQGLTTVDNLESLKAQAAQSEYQIDDARLNLEQNKLMLEYLTNMKVRALRYENLLLPEFELKERDDISALEYEIQAQKYQLKQLHYYPTIDISNVFTYNIQKRPLTGGAAMGSFAAIFNPTMQNVVSISISWKLLDTIGTSIQRQYQRVGQLAIEQQLYYKRMEQRKDEELYRKTLEIAERKIKSAKANLKSANIAYSNIKKKYDANLINFTDYLQALSTKFDAESIFSQSLNNYEMQKANYIFYSGQKIKDYLKEQK